jgi:hypothetical protein
MVVLAKKHSSRLAQGQACAGLCLRIVGTARNGQIVRLAAPKCTIGSARGCTLRLVAAGVRPLHCVILCGSRGTVIRCWDADTRLNGHTFSDALLVVGDRLTIGPIELEVVASDAAAPMSRELANASEAQSSTQIAISPAFQRPDNRPELAAHAPQIAEELAQLESARTALQQQRQQWEEETARARRDLQDKQEGYRRAQEEFRLAQDSLEQQRGAWAIENTRVQMELEHERAALLQQREEITRWLQELERNRVQSQTRFESELAQLEQVQKDWKNHQTDEERRLAEEWAQLDVQRAELRHSHEERETLRQTARQEREQTADELVAARQQDGQPCAELRDRLAPQAAIQQQQQAELERRTLELDTANRELGRRETAVAQAVAAAQATARELSERRVSLEAQAAAMAPTGVDVAPTTEREQRLRVDREELGAQRAEFEREQRIWREAQVRHDAMNTEHLEKLKSRTDSMRQQEETLQAERQELARARQEQETKLAEKAQAVDQLAAQVETRRAALDVECKARQADQEQAAAAQRSRAAELESREGELPQRLETTTRFEQETLELERRRAELEAERRAWQEEKQNQALLRAEAEPDNLRPTADDDSPDTASSWSAVAEHEPARAEISAEQAASPRAQPRDDEPPQRSEGEESIEDYMAGLLNRMRGGNASDALFAPNTKPKRKSDSAPSPKPSTVEQAGRDVSSGQIVDMPLTSGELARRPQPVETSDLAAMREVANTHARSAIDTHGKKRLLIRAMGSFGAALVFLAGTLAVFHLGPADDQTMRTGAMTLVVASVYWTYVGVRSARQLIPWRWLRATSPDSNSNPTAPKAKSQAS